MWVVVCGQEQHLLRGVHSIYSTMPFGGEQLRRCALFLEWLSGTSIAGVVQSIGGKLRLQRVTRRPPAITRVLVNMTNVRHSEFTTEGRKPTTSIPVILNKILINQENYVAG